jgi:predicted metalloprotease with PDZ domain
MKSIITALVFLIMTACAGPGAIGVAYNQEGIVRYVFKNSPAEKAGIVVGDKILNRKELRGDIGTMCRVKVEREGQYIEKLIQRLDVDKLTQQDHGSW